MVHTIVDIAANRVTDVREVLNYYKSFEGKSVLEVFRGNYMVVS